MQQAKAADIKRRTMRHLSGVALAAAGLMVSACASGGDPSGAGPSPKAEDSVVGGRACEVAFGAPAPVAALWPVFAGIDQGIFKGRNTTVDLKFVGGGQGVQQLVAGEMDLFLTNPDQPIVAQKQTDALVGIGTGINSPFSVIAGPGISGYADLRGKKLGVANLGGSDAVLLKAALSANGLAEGEYNLVQAGSGPNKIAAMTSGAVVATTLTQPQDFQFLEKTPNSSRLGYSPTDIQSIATFANRKWAEQNSECLTRFLQGYNEAAVWLSDGANKAEAAASFDKHTKSTVPIAEQVYDLYTEQDLFKDPMVPNYQRLDAYLKLSTAATGTRYEPAQSYFDTSYLDKAKK